jgi:hypothetical protein
MAATYTPIASITLGATASSVTLSSIPQTYTDLVLRINANSSSTATYTKVRYNSDTATNYSRTSIAGITPTSTNTYNEINQTSFAFGDLPATGANFSPQILNIFNYANTTTYKTVLERDGFSTIVTSHQAGLWRSTAAITSITLFTNANSFGIGSTFDLYGILGGNA